MAHVTERGTEAPVGAGEGPGLDLAPGATGPEGRLEELLLSQCPLPSGESSPAPCRPALLQGTLGRQGP